MEIRNQRLRLKDQGLGFTVKGIRLRVQGIGFRVQV